MAIEPAVEIGEIDRAVSVRSEDFDLGAETPGELEQPEVMAVVGGPIDQHTATMVKPAGSGQAPQRLGKPCRVTWGQGDLGGPGIEQLRGRRRGYG